MMNQAQFDRVFNALTPRRREVLLKFLAGETDEVIANSLSITRDTVRQHIKDISELFGFKNDLPDERRSKRSDLIALFAKYKPDLVRNSETGTSNESESAPAITPEPANQLKPAALDIPTVVNEGEPAPAITPKPALTNDPAAFDLNFVGRQSAITEINKLVSQGAKVIVIQAAGGVGKTTLAKEYLKTQRFELVIELTMAKETESITAVESVIEEWLKQDFKEEPGREFGITLGRLKRQLQTRRVGILIDNLEPALDKQGKFIEPHRRYVELLRVLADSTVQSLTLITSRECLCESGVTVERYRLPGLNEPAWKKFFSNRNINIDAPTLKAMHNAYGGNAKAMRIFCGAIREDFDGDMAAYWQENGTDLLLKPDLKDLITSQFIRLQEICPKAYKLMCRLGCFRYQDVPVVPTEGILCLLWDIPEAQRIRIIESLRNRSLVECRKGEYWLHPVIRAEAISRLRESEDWEEANRKAAEYWTERVKTVETVEDALTAFEAYYHYLEIDDFEQAGNVIIKERKNKWVKFSPLGVSFYRFGLLSSMISSINLILSKIPTGYILGRIYSILGDLYWMSGRIKNAIKCHQKSGQLAISCKSMLLDKDHPEEPDSKLRKRLEVGAIFNVGLCQIDLWELEKAKTYFEKTLLLTELVDEIHHYSYKQSLACWFCLAFLNAYLKIQDTLFYLEKAYKIIEYETTEWGTGNQFIFLGLTCTRLGNIEQALYFYNRAIKYAEESSYIQVRAKALNGIAELYREQGKFDTALTHHSKAIELLDKIGAKCDLAEAHYQLALTYQKMGKTENAEVNFQEAIRLYTEMEAPKQVEKVLQAMGDK